jgi:hypothetical protein
MTGKIHIVQLQIGDCFFPCSITVMDDATLPPSDDNKNRPDSNDTGTTALGTTDANAAAATAAKLKEMDFLLGLDMLKRFNCMIDLGDGTLKFRLGDKTMSTPFLHEKDLDQSKGGTKGFNPDLNNQEWMAAQQQYEEETKKDKDRMQE